MGYAEEQIKDYMDNLDQNYTIDYQEQDQQMEGDFLMAGYSIRDYSILRVATRNEFYNKIKDDATQQRDITWLMLIDKKTGVIVETYRRGEDVPHTRI